MERELVLILRVWEILHLMILWGHHSSTQACDSGSHSSVGPQRAELGCAGERFHSREAQTALHGE